MIVFVLLAITGLGFQIKMAACVDDLQSMHFSMPSLTEEEEHSMHLPDTFKCDACKAVAFQVRKIKNHFLFYLLNKCCKDVLFVKVRRSIWEE